MRLNFKGALAAVVFLAGCVTLPDDIGDGTLTGRVFVEWQREDGFIYRNIGGRGVSFKPSFLDVAIVPEDMYTTGGSVPRVFWSIPGLSPWALGPAYILHDWIFEVHRCNRDAPPQVQNLSFEDSALVLAEVGKALIAAGLVDNDKLPAILWAVRTRYARSLWNTPGTAEDCLRPDPVRVAGDRADVKTIVDFTIPPPLDR